MQACPVVPDPANVSSTISPSLECFLIKSEIKLKGFCVGCSDLSLP